MDPLDFDQPVRSPGFLELLKHVASSIHYLMISLSEAGVPRRCEELEVVRSGLLPRHREFGAERCGTAKEPIGGDPNDTFECPPCRISCGIHGARRRATVEIFESNSPQLTIQNSGWWTIQTWNRSASCASVTMAPGAQQLRNPCTAACLVAALAS